ncbi:MAG: hypothetical protein HY696_11045 [Deltaproteobacteria bacterium]|nr:hypothetical protein [Deltaproteobacteria bacterium]
MGRGNFPIGQPINPPYDFNRDGIADAVLMISHDQPLPPPPGSRAQPGVISYFAFIPALTPAGATPPARPIHATRFTSPAKCRLPKTVVVGTVGGKPLRARVQYWEFPADPATPPFFGTTQDTLFRAGMRVWIRAARRADTIDRFILALSEYGDPLHNTAVAQLRSHPCRFIPMDQLAARPDTPAPR